MSRGARIFLAVSIVWACLWGMGSYLFFRAARSGDREAERTALPATGLTPGADVRFDGVIDDRSPVEAPLTQEKCAAARMSVYYVTWAYDGQQKPYRLSELVTTRDVPERVGVLAGQERVELPLEHWRPPPSKSSDDSRVMDSLPERLQIQAADVARAKAAAGDRKFVEYAADEWRLKGGQPVFVQGHLESVANRLVLSPDSVLGKVAIFKGTQAEAVAAQQSGSSGLRTAGYVFIGLAALPIFVFSLYQTMRPKAR